MFEHADSVVGLSPGERLEEVFDLDAEDQLAYEITCRSMADGWSEPDRHVLPDDLEEIVPGPFLAAILSAVDPAKLNGYDAVRLMQARARLSSHHDAGKYEAMAEVALSPAGDSDSPVERSIGEDLEFVAPEIAAALTLTRRASEGELDRAISLSDRLHRVRQAFSEGRLDVAKVRVFVQMLDHLPPDTIDFVLDRVLDDAEDLTSGQVRARVGRLVMEADPDGAKSSYEQGLADRKITTSSNPDHTANYIVSAGPPDEIAAARNHVEDLARSLKALDEETRTLDQLRTDISLDLLQGKHPLDGCNINTAGLTNINIPAETLIGLSNKPGELAGFAPVIAEIARKTVYENVDGQWEFTVTDQGRPVSTGTLARRPTRSQCRQIKAQHPKCVFPGCRFDAENCDLDHRKPHSQGGPTHNDNLEPLCRHHHRLRHHKPWQVKPQPDGNHEWTSPLGHTYIRKRDPPD